MCTRSVKRSVRLWLRGEGLRSIERPAGMHRKAVRRNVTAAGLDRSGVELQVDFGKLSLIPGAAVRAGGGVLGVDLHLLLG